MHTTLSLLLTLMVSLSGGAYRDVAHEIGKQIDSLPIPIASAESVVQDSEDDEEISRLEILPAADIPLLIVGEGGTSGFLFQKAAQTFRREKGGEIAVVHDGDEMVRAMRRFVRKHGRISQMVYFGHGNHVGLYVNQEPGVNGAFYANDPRLNRRYRAGSFYSLKPEIFAEGGETVFFGCNVANGYPTYDTLAERFANHFNITVYAAMGPTEFSRVPDRVDPYPLAKYLPGDFDAPVYMVATSERQGIIRIDPAPSGFRGYMDVYSGMEGEAAIRELWRRGLDLADDEKGLFQPYKVITYSDAKEFCKVAAGKDAKCSLSAAYEYGPDDPIRNLHALKMLTESFGFSVAHNINSHVPFLRWAWQYDGLLTRDFDQKMWYTRAEMAQLSMNFAERFEE